MTRKLSFIAVVAGLALVAAVPALGKPIPSQESQETLVGPMEARSDAFERAVQAHVSSTPSVDTRVGPIGPAESNSNGLHQYFSSTPSVDTGVGPMETRSDGLHWYWVGKSSEGAIAADAFERAVQAHVSSTPSGDGFLAGDDHARIDPSQLPTVVVASSPSGNEFEWPQIGIGFLVGILLMLGIGLTVRFTRIPPLAH